MTEQDLQSSAVLRREAEQLLDLLSREFITRDGDYDTLDGALNAVEAFASRQRAQALNDAAEFLEGEADDDAGTLASAMELRRRAAAEGTEP